MVMLKPESAKQFPKFERYLREEFFHVQTKSRVMDAFFKWCAWPKSDPAKYTYSHFRSAERALDRFRRGANQINLVE